MRRLFAQQLAKNRGKKALQLVDSAIEKAIEGSAPHLKIIVDSTDGLLTQKIDATIDDVSGLTNEQRVARASQLLDTARTRRDGSAAGDGSDESDV
jgi:hypothetical protein